MDETLWQKCATPWLPRRKAGGGWTLTVGAGQAWRRRRPDGKWEYAQDAISQEEWERRQW